MASLLSFRRTAGLHAFDDRAQPLISAAGRRLLLRCGGRAAGRLLLRMFGELLLVDDARPVLAGTVAVDGALTGRVEGFPGDASGIVDPGFLGLGVAARGLA